MKKFVEWAIGVLAALVIFFFGANYIMRIITRQDKSIMTPNIVGMDFEEVYDLLIDKDLYLKKESTVFSSTIPRGCIISQRPLPGSIVKPGRKIKAIVSEGPREVVVPKLIDQSIREAEILLHQLGLSIGEKRAVFSADVKKEIVISQIPLSGTTVQAATLVELVISRGKASVEIVLPDFLHESILEAEEIVTGLGLKRGEFSTEIHNDLPQGTIVKQYPPAGTVVEKDSEVHFTITTTSETMATEVPYLRTIHYELSQGSISRRIRIIVIDQTGEREVYNKIHPPGFKINTTVNIKGEAKAKIFLDGVLVETQQL